MGHHCETIAVRTRRTSPPGAWTSLWAIASPPLQHIADMTVKITVDQEA